MQYFVGPMDSASKAMNGVVAPAMTPSQVNPKKRTMVLSMLYTAHTLIYIRSAADAREKTKQAHAITSINLQWPVCESIKGM